MRVRFPLLAPKDIQMENLEPQQPDSGETPEIQRGNNVYLTVLRQSIDEQDTAKLRMIVDAIQNQIHKLPKVQIAPMTEHDLRDIMEGRDAMMVVGSGTNGERVYFLGKDREIFMPEKQEEGLSHQRYYDNFRYLFDIGEDQKLRVKF